MRRFIYTASLLGLTLFSQAQHGGIGIIVGVPQNEFRVATEAEGIGLNANFLGRVGGDVIYMGANLNYQVYGFNARNQNLTAEITANGVPIQGVDPIVIPLRIINTNQIFGMHGMMRIMVPGESVRPYIEGLFGFRYLATTTKIQDRDNFWNDDEDNVLVRRTNLDDFVLSYGGGGGLQIAVSEGVFLDLRAYYLLGGNADFFDGSDTEDWEIEFGGTSFNPDNINPDEFNIGAQPRNSTTDMLMFQLGLTFDFGL